PLPAEGAGPPLTVMSVEQTFDTSRRRDGSELQLLEPPDLGNPPQIVLHSRSYDPIAPAPLPTARRRLEQSRRAAKPARQPVRVRKPVRSRSRPPPSERHLDLRARRPLPVRPERGPGRRRHDTER